jgi:hypothetical protein
MEEVFRLIAGKRGERIGWVSREAFWAHSRKQDQLIWVPADEQQVAEAKPGIMQRPDDVLALIPVLDPISQDQLWQQCKEKLHGMGVIKARQFVNVLLDEGKVFNHKILRAGAKAAIGYAKSRPNDGIIGANASESGTFRMFTGKV